MGGDANFGGAASAPAATGTAIFLDEFTLDGASSTPTQTIALPTTTSGAQRGIVDSGSASSTGFVTRTGDGSAVVTGGYDVGVGNAIGGAAATNNRIIARVDGGGNVDTSTGYSDDSAGATLRSVAASGSNYYAGTASSSASTLYINTPGAIDTSTTRVGGGAVRTDGIYANRLFVSVNSTFESIKDTATGGLPTATAASNTITTFTLPIASSEQFAMADLSPSVGFDGTGLDTLYIADPAAISGTSNPTTSTESGGGIQKYVYNGTTWNLTITYNAGLSSTNTDHTFGGIVGVAFVALDDSGNPILFATTAAPNATGNALMRIVDAGPLSSYTLVANAPTNTMFRGVAAPLPEPAGCAMLGLGALGLLRRRRRARATMKQINENEDISV
jgi:hypothetical protein